MKYKIYAGLFLFLCLFPVAAIPIFGIAQPVANETLAPAPALIQAGSLNKNILQEITDYIGDRFALRQEMITLEHTLIAGLFQESAAKEVILGQEGWLFYSETLDDYEGLNLMTERQRWSAARILSLIQEYCAKRQINFLFTIVPNKNSLYGEYMPKRYPKATEAGNLELLATDLKEQGVNYLDLFSELENQEAILYRRLDSHWTQQGAALAGDRILTALGKDFKLFGTGEFKGVQKEIGDLYAMLYPTGQELDWDQEGEQEFTFSYTRSIRSPEEQMILTSCVGKTGKLLMFRDSFGNALYPFLAEEFGEACFCRDNPYNLGRIRTNKPDTVVIELVERNLAWLVSKPAIFPAPVREIDANSLPETKIEAVLSSEINNSLSGYAEVSGSFQVSGLDNNSPIYLKVGSVVYEASPASLEEESWDEGFRAYIPAAKASESMRILVSCAGQLIKSPEIEKER